MEYQFEAHMQKKREMIHSKVDRNLEKENAWKNIW